MNYISEKLHPSAWPPLGTAVSSTKTVCSPGIPHSHTCSCQAWKGPRHTLNKEWSCQHSTGQTPLLEKIWTNSPGAAKSQPFTPQNFRYTFLVSTADSYPLILTAVLYPSQNPRPQICSLQPWEKDLILSLCWKDVPSPYLLPPPRKPSCPNSRTPAFFQVISIQLWNYVPMSLGLIH